MGVSKLLEFYVSVPKQNGGDPSGNDVEIMRNFRPIFDGLHGFVRNDEIESPHPLISADICNPMHPLAFEFVNVCIFTLCELISQF
jgi:hypothetical protein